LLLKVLLVENVLMVEGLLVSALTETAISKFMVVGILIARVVAQEGVLMLRAI